MKSLSVICLHEKLEIVPQMNLILLLFRVRVYKKVYGKQFRTCIKMSIKKLFGIKYFQNLFKKQVFKVHVLSCKFKVFCMEETVSCQPKFSKRAT